MKNFNTLYNMLMESFVTEKRNPKHDYSEYTLRDLARKFSSDDYIFRFSNSNDRAAFNPKAYYNTTPIGTYGYPARYFLKSLIKDNNLDFYYKDTNKNFDYGSNMKFLYILKKKDGYKTFDTSKQINNNDIEKLIKLNIISNTDLNRISTNKDLYFYIKNKNIKNKNLPSFLTNIFFKALGYDSIKDNFGVIHENEPHQEVIINPVGFNVVEKIDNSETPKIEKIDYNMLFKNKNYKKLVDKIISLDVVKGIDGTFKNNNLIKVIKMCKEAFNIGFSKKPESIKYVPEEKRYDVIKLCKEGFGEGFKKDPRLLDNIPEDKRCEIIKICNKEAFNMLYAENPGCIADIPEDKRYDVIKMCQVGFNKGFKKYPRIIKYIPEDKMLDVIILCRDGFNDGFKKDAVAIERIPKQFYKQLKELFPDINFPK